MTANKKTDNHDPAAKLALRQHFLRRYHADTPPRVLDCCQGGGVLWGTLRGEFAVASYWGLDLKPKKGRLKVDSVRVLCQPGWAEDVIDVDTYGLPWKHWLALLPNVTKPTTVFLTVGATVIGHGSMASREELQALGLAPFRGKIPMPFTLKLLRTASLPYLLSAPHRHGLTIVEAVEAVSNGNARYFGLRLSLNESS